MGNGNGLDAEIAGQRIKAHGLVVIMLLLTLMLCAMMLYGFSLLQMQNAQIQRQHEAMVHGINDLFIAIAMPEEKKQQLPSFMKERLKDKFKDKAEQLTDKKE